MRDDVEHLRACRAHGGVTGMLVCDFADSFHTFAMRSSERRYLVTEHLVSGLVIFHMVLFGGAECLLVLGRSVGYLVRAGQGLFCGREVRVQIHEDEPLVVQEGKPRSAGKWRGVGVHFTWCAPGETVVTIPAKFVHEMSVETTELVSTRDEKLERYAGATNLVAGIVPVLRSFLAIWCTLGEARRDTERRMEEGLEEARVTSDRKDRKERKCKEGGERRVKGGSAWQDVGSERRLRDEEPSPKIDTHLLGEGQRSSGAPLQAGHQGFTVTNGHHHECQRLGVGAWVRWGQRGSFRTMRTALRVWLKVFSLHRWRVCFRSRPLCARWARRSRRAHF